MSEELLKSIDKKLNKVIALLIIQNVQDKDDKIFALKNMGFTSDEISPIVNIKNVRDTKGWKKR
ncbi:MAG: hypothetical protein Q7S06_00620 [Nanoarchaeota archaeon]|nr:hypothetical protein [Nanoarchaeota archaeon]